MLTPNRRLARAIRSAYDEHQAANGSRAWATPVIMPLGQWLEECWSEEVMRGALEARQILDVPRQRRLWRQIIESDDRSFSLLGPAPAAQRCQQARAALKLWQVPLSDSAVAQEFSFSEDSAAFHRWLARFDAHCNDAGLICPEDALAQLLDAQSSLSAARAVLIDAEELPPLHATLLAKTADLQRLDTGFEGEQTHPVQAFADTRSELQAVSRWCLQRVEESREGRYAVVMQDMHQARELLEMFLRKGFNCLTARYESLPVNFATGLTLDRVPLVRDALRVLTLGGVELVLDDFVKTLHSRFVPPPALGSAALNEGLNALLELGSARLPLRIVQQLLPARGDSQAPMPWEQMALLARQGRWQQRARAPSQWIEPFRVLLGAWGWPMGASLDSLEHQQFEHWQQALDALATYDVVCGDIPWSDAVALLREHCSQSLFQPRTEDAAIQVLGPLETTGLRFDAMWVVGMSALQWPPAPRPNPYLPRNLQRRLRMPHADVEWEREAAVRRLARWRHSARDLQASFVDRQDDSRVPVSPLLRNWEQTPGKASEEVDHRWVAQREHIIKTAISLAEVPLGSAERARKHVAAGMLQEMAACPFQAFASRRLQATPRQEPVSGLSPGERGSLVHDALYRIFGVIVDSAALREKDPPALTALITEAVTGAMGTLSDERRELLGTAVLQLEKVRLAALLGSWLALEKQRPGSFTVREREVTREISLAGLTLRMRLDRVDELHGGARMIIDYKSGRGDSISGWFSAPPSRPQLPLYGLLDPPADAIAYATLAPGDQGFKGVGAESFVAGVSDDVAKASRNPDIAGMNEARAFWRESLDGIALDFAAGRADVDPSKEACRYCARQALCRIAEYLE